MENKTENNSNSNLIPPVGEGAGCHRRWSGYAAAFYLSRHGHMNVTLVDPGKNPGGVCLYRGCIPSKHLLHGNETSERNKRSKNGHQFGEPEIDLL